MHLYVKTLKGLSVSFTTVVESHPDNALEDLRLDQPFTELKHHVESCDLDNMEKKVRQMLITDVLFIICD